MSPSPGDLLSLIDSNPGSGLCRRLYLDPLSLDDEPGAGCWYPGEVGLCAGVGGSRFLVVTSAGRVGWVVSYGGYGLEFLSPPAGGG